jgi:hypothetical protein
VHVIDEVDPHVFIKSMWSISRTWCNEKYIHEWTETVQQLGFLEHAEQPKMESQPAAGGGASIPNLHWHLDQTSEAVHRHIRVCLCPTLEKKVHMSG